MTAPMVGRTKQVPGPIPIPDTSWMVRAELPQVDYEHTSSRPTWSQLPQLVRETVGRLAGGVVAAADPPVTSGFSGAYAGRVTLVDGRRFFAKAGSPTQPFVVAALTQESEVLARLPAGIPAPALVGFAAVEGWNVLVLEVVPGRMPGAPWTPPEVDAVHDACLVMAELGTPSTLGGRDLGDRITNDQAIIGVGRAMARSAFGRGRDLPGLPAWFERHQHRVGEMVLDAGSRFDGDTLCHGDLRPDNLLVDLGSPSARTAGATVVDWNWVGTAAAWVDWFGLLPLMAAQGHDVDALVSGSPLTRDADPDDLDAYLAVIAAYMLAEVDAPPPPGCTPALRRHQALMASVFLDLLRRRRRWD